jgi:hypothetical protein
MRHFAAWALICTVAVCGCGPAEKERADTPAKRSTAAVETESFRGAIAACRLSLEMPGLPRDGSTSQSDAAAEIERYSVGVSRIADAARQIAGDGAKRVAELGDQLSLAVHELAAMKGDFNTPEAEFKGGAVTGVADRLDAFCASADRAGTG